MFVFPLLKKSITDPDQSPACARSRQNQEGLLSQLRCMCLPLRTGGGSNKVLSSLLRAPQNLKDFLLCIVVREEALQF